ncbi:hypothetical protein GDO86_011888 [Hymenochirus boettgeri]|uniref:Uncharacterized protein n=1 Tax=Hymenochirus boettgeri TaxID=247094 RepID=A0A8T2JI67_9PIPI|nr:hypothetical protein GDO86_011888 [Hymenochirus boettgeri]
MNICLLLINSIVNCVQCYKNISILFLLDGIAVFFTANKEDTPMVSYCIDIANPSRILLSEIRTSQIETKGFHSCHNIWIQNTKTNLLYKMLECLKQKTNCALAIVSLQGEGLYEISKRNYPLREVLMTRLLYYIPIL